MIISYGVIPSLWAQESAIGSGSYRILNYDYQVEGKTRPDSVDNYLYSYKEEGFPDYISMHRNALEMRQILINMRIFESVEIELLPVPSDSEDKEPAEAEFPPGDYTLIFHLKDSWTFFPLIVPTLDSNNFLTLQMKMNYDNVFGSLVTFILDGDIGIGVDQDSSKPMINFWEFETGFSNLMYRGVNFGFSWVQTYDRIIKKDGLEILENYSYHKTDFIMTAGFNLGSDYYYELAPAIELSYNYEDRTGNGNGYIQKEPQSYGIYQTIGRDRVNWVGNFQEGYNWEAELQSRYVPKSGFKGRVTLSNRWYHIFNSRLNYSSKATALTGLNEDIPELGVYMRGVPDFNLTGRAAFFLNNTLAVKLFTWKGVAEAQIQPFADFGVVAPSGRGFEAHKDMRMAIGFDGVAFPEKISNISLRGTIGIDLFGPGDILDRLEILISTSLFY
ncbi:MAG: hypothetical protein PQJ50_02030 [Spirochaetales bacterium]|nr:hypothetical protein [Spirochaetales bacterium]